MKPCLKPSHSWRAKWLSNTVNCHIREHSFLQLYVQILHSNVDKFWYRKSLIDEQENTCIVRAHCTPRGLRAYRLVCSTRCCRIRLSFKRRLSTEAKNHLVGVGSRKGLFMCLLLSLKLYLCISTTGYSRITFTIQISEVITNDELHIFAFHMVLYICRESINQKKYC